MTEQLTACKNCKHLVWEWNGAHYQAHQDARCAQSLAKNYGHLYETGPYDYQFRYGPIPPDPEAMCIAATKQVFDPVEGKTVYTSGHAKCIEHNPDGHCPYFDKNDAGKIIVIPRPERKPWWKRLMGKE